MHVTLEAANQVCSGAAARPRAEDDATRLFWKAIPSPEAQLEKFIDRYTPDLAALARAVLARMRSRLPGAVELVYDNYYALVVGFGPTERASDAVFSVVLYPRWVSLFFLEGAFLSDPRQLLKGNGKLVRHIVIKGAGELDSAGIRALMSAAIHRAEKAIDENAPRRIVIKAIASKQRPRRPALKRAAAPCGR